MQNIEQIYQQYAEMVCKYIFCLTHDWELAEEITQETFAVAVKDIHKFKGECKVSVWLCQIAKYIWYKELRKKRHKEVPLEEVLDTMTQQDLIEDIILEKESKLSLFKKIEKLEEPAKSVIYLKMMGDLNFIEIAEILNRTPNWVRVTFYRAKQKLKEERNE